MIYPGAILRHDIQNGHPVSPFIGIYDAFSATIAAKHSPNLFLLGVRVRGQPLRPAGFRIHRLERHSTSGLANSPNYT